LTISDFIEYSKEKKEVMKFLPDERDIANVPRDYLINVINSVVGDEFRQWVEEKVSARNEQIKLNTNQYISLDPQIAKIFASASHSSCKSSRFIYIKNIMGKLSNVVTANLLKQSSKRRKTKVELEQIARQKEFY